MWLIRQIAQGLGRAPSTVSREIRRNAGSQAYRANRADRRARERALRPKPCRLALYSELRWRVAQKLALQWSPQQISGWLHKLHWLAEQGFDAVAKAELWERWRRGIAEGRLGEHLASRRRRFIFRWRRMGGFVLRRGGVPGWH